eukprot:TRINITY_DN600_c0_g2_i2.p1 TRINITY_DN600_c0_g2~~TRINITY_DN600_c0_g2_i2.p1  ORF type:complete len:712 (-),score=188.31 TRINITY_DN600_c0_g2_i2:74-2041(-)
MAEVAVDQLFRALDEQVHGEEYDKAIETCTKILEAESGDTDALATQLLCFIHVGRFDDALQLLDANAAIASERQFERSYILYRLGRFEDAQAALSQCTENGAREKELAAQIEFKRGHYSECVELYEGLLVAKEDDGNRMELFSNLAAALAAASLSEQALESYEKNKEALQSSYEYLFNIACACVFARDYENAEKLLKQAESACIKSMEEDGYDEKDIQSEAAAIRVQLSYVYQLLGRPSAQALDLLEGVLQSQCPRAVAAVAENNCVSIRRDHKLFNAEKKLALCVDEKLQPILTEEQKKIFQFNNALVHLKMGKSSQTKDLVDRLAQQYPDSSMPAIIEASSLLRDKKRDEAIAVLQEFADAKRSPPQERSVAVFCLAQLQIQAKNAPRCIEALRMLDNEEKFRPPVVASVVHLLEMEGEMEKASEFLQESVSYWTEQHKSSPQLSAPILSVLLRAAGDFHLQRRQGALAAKFFVALSKFDGSTTNSTPSLVKALAYEDPDLAEKYGKDLPEITIPDSINAAELENLPPPKARMSSSKVAASEDTEKTDAPAKTKPKAKRKRKPRLPKDYPDCGPPNPERWLPRHMRSGYKAPKGRKPRELRGAQGIGVTTNPEMDASAAASTSSAPPPSSAKAPAKAAPAASKKAKNKKKRKK